MEFDTVLPPDTINALHLYWILILLGTDMTENVIYGADQLNVKAE